MPRDINYASPLTKRGNDKEKLTLETLKKYVPAAQKALKAQEKLNNEPHISDQERVELLRAIKDGEYAKERLVIISMPLVKTLAYNEFKRRQSWDSRVSLEDILSEGMSGLMRGIRAYDVNGAHKSPTNYLGQWIITDMRRNTESMDHDFSIPYEAIERHRKIRAIRSRLTLELGREPTDEEIIEGSKDEAHMRNKKMGRSADKKQEQKESGAVSRRVLTAKHIEEERMMYARTGAFQSTSITDNGEERNLAQDSIAKAISPEEKEELPQDFHSDIDNQEIRKSLSNLIESSMSLMGMGDVQRDIVRRKFGISPYTDEETIKSIVVNSGIPKHRVTRIITAYSAAMCQKNGAFHKMLWDYGYDEAESLGLGWLFSQLGEFQHPLNNNNLKELQIPLIPKKNGEIFRPVMTTSNNLSSSGVLATFSCPRGHQSTLAFLSKEDVPQYKKCMFEGCNNYATKL